ncbi:MAG: hypothetical protein WBK24_06865, partial [Dethiobacteria bacterium]
SPSSFIATSTDTLSNFPGVLPTAFTDQPFCSNCDAEVAKKSAYIKTIVAIKFPIRAAFPLFLPGAVI